MHDYGICKNTYCCYLCGMTDSLVNLDVDLPKVDLPQVDLPQVDLPQLAENLAQGAASFLPPLHQAHIPFINEILSVLAATLIVVLLLQRLKLSVVVGYLLAGVAIGPFGFALIGEVEQVRAFAELGVGFLLFLIGLELSWQRLVEMRRLVFGLGGGQVLGSTILVGVIAYLWGNTLVAAIILGGCLALSSTAVVMQLLIERGEAASRTGQSAFAILLMQDLAVVPLLVLVAVLSAGQASLGAALMGAFINAVLVVGVILLLGRFVIRPLFHRTAALNMPELSLVLSLFVVLGIATLTALAGISFALGAFLAGVLLADSEFRHQVEADIKPFKALLLGLFFMSVGMSIDIHLLQHQWFWVMASVLGLLAIKATLIYLLARKFFRHDHATALALGLLLGGGGEFAFVVVGAASAGGLIKQDIAQFMLLVAALSIMLTPFVAKFEQRLRVWQRQRSITVQQPEPTELMPETHPVIVVGYGRVGQRIVRILRMQQVPYIVVDEDVERVQQGLADGVAIHYGVSTNITLLESFGAGQASAIILAINKPDSISHTLTALRAHWPDLPIYARAHDAKHGRELLAAGANGVVQVTLESSLSLAEYALHAADIPHDIVEDLLIKARLNESVEQASA